MYTATATIATKPISCTGMAPAERLPNRPGVGEAGRLADRVSDGMAGKSVSPM